ncbi:MerR family transcriptional regulator [Streptomyces sp. RFCAC02]|uniref:helix-turn-helix domain-containing protein n=1 Tax=Streptomyces sp. RFCAC02 TaxID=2499143 RepID=UPI001020044C|nr:MerR family transcriptional regulator [Streptomyces sp. RFCAC02]
MTGEPLLTIGDLSRRTGLPVRTIRFWSDEGLVPPTDRTPAGHRLYDTAALARLALVRTLRDLGVDLAAVRRVVARDLSVPEVAAAHADALDAQIRTLRMRRAVLRVVAARGSTTEEIAFMHRLALLSDEERRRLIHDFIDAAFGGLEANPEFVAMMRGAMPDLPDDPTPEQADAWVELAQLTQDPAFRAAVRRMAEHQAADRSAGDDTGLHHELTAYVRETVGEALAAGVRPDAPEAGPYAARMLARYAETFGRPDDAALRGWVLERLDAGNDPRAERYWHLLAVINGWPVPPSLTPVFAWFTEALRAAEEG